MRLKYENGLLPTAFKSGAESLFWKEDRDSVSRLYRSNFDFQKNDRESLFMRAKDRCEKCGISKETLSIEKSLLSRNRLTLECDHKIPISLGGEKNWETNGMVLCSRCHIIKTLKERQPFDQHEEIQNRFNSEPVQVLKSMFGGKIDFENLILKITDKCYVYISPLTDKYISRKYLISDLKSSNPNLLIFFSDEWVSKRDIILSIIRNKLTMSKNRFFARKCKIVDVSYSEAISFFQNNHLSSAPRDISKSFGLQIDDRLVSVISFRKPSGKKYLDYIEIARFANLLNSNVVGGFGKLLKHSKKYFDKIMTYADLRIGHGNVYLTSGFSLIGKTDLDYFYTNGYSREGRLKYRAKESTPEKDIALAAGVKKAYSTGSNIFLME